MSWRNCVRCSDKASQLHILSCSHHICGSCLDEVLLQDKNNSVKLQTQTQTQTNHIDQFEKDDPMIVDNPVPSTSASAIAEPTSSSTSTSSSDGKNSTTIVTNQKVITLPFTVDSNTHMIKEEKPKQINSNTFSLTLPSSSWPSSGVKESSSSSSSSLMNEDSMEGKKKREMSSERSGWIVCPECGEQFLKRELIKNPPVKNIWVERLSKIESIKDPGVCELCQELETKYLCLNCSQFSCERCAMIHKRARISKHHDVKEKSEFKLGLMKLEPECDYHTGVTIDTFCATCSVPCCPKCLVLHQSHSTVLLSSMANNCRQRLSEQLKECREKLSKMEQNTRKSGETFEDKCDKAQNTMEEYFKTIEDLVLVKKREMNEQLEETRKQRKKTLEETGKQIQKIIHSIRNGCDMIDMMLRDANDSELSQMSTVTLPMLKKFIDGHKWEKSAWLNEDIEFIPPSDDPQESLKKILGEIKTGWTDPMSCTVQLPQFPSIGRECSLFITSKTNKQENVTSGGDPFHVEITSPYNTQCDCVICDEQSGTYHVKFTPQVEGEHRVQVWLGNEKVGEEKKVDVKVCRNYHNLSSPKAVFNVDGSPYGVAVDMNGNIVVCDHRGNKVNTFDSTGKLLQTFGRASGSGDGELSSPWGVIVNMDGNIVVGDCSNHRIQVFSPTGQFIRSFGARGEGNSRFDCPAYLAQDKQGRYYVTDDQHVIQVFDQNWNFLYRIGSRGTANGEFMFPEGIAIDSQGRIVVVDHGNHRIQIFDSSGRFLTKIGSKGKQPGSFESPWSVAIDPWDNIIVTDTNNNRVQIFSPDGVFLKAIPGFNKPYGVACSSQGDIIVSDTSQSQIKIL